MINKILELFDSREEIPLFYSENGSRLWGIASPDSDFDIRGMHLPSSRQYFDYCQAKEQIEIMDGDFDFVSFSLDKLFSLLAQSNPSVLEWVRSHQVYLNELPEWNRFRTDLLASIHFKSLFYHYLSLAVNHLKMIKSGKKSTFKTVFYSARGLLSAASAYQSILPELDMEQLCLQFSPMHPIVELIQKSIEKKRSQAESMILKEDEKDICLTILQTQIEQLNALKMVDKYDNTTIKSVLTDYSIFIKSRYY